VSVSLSPLNALAERLGIRFDSDQLALALTHSSYAAEHDAASNERLEFLGDAVVNLAIADLILRDYPDFDEGTSSVLRSRVVNEEALARAASRLDLANCVRIGRGVMKEKGLERPSLLADAFEAVVAALYLERGYDAAKHFVQELLHDEVLAASTLPDTLDVKTRLRQWADVHHLGTPSYVVSSSGPSHDTTFFATVRVGTTLEVTGKGRSKKRAETNAAQLAWETLRDA
jgi:ribonuclease-3